MEKIYSKVNPTQLLHIVSTRSQITETRCDISPADEFLQVSCFELPKGKTFRPHYHVPLERHTTITQESWVVIQGKIKAVLYDTDNQIVAERTLTAGDISITFHGGHNYISLEDHTQVYEFKTGPYMGQAKDKEFID